MSSDTAAQSSDAAEPVRTIEPAAQVPRQEPAPRRPEPLGLRPSDFDRPGRHEDQTGLLWTVVTAVAAVLFCAALVFGATRLFIADTAGTVTDTPERTVSAFLGALLGERDAEAAAAWLCTDKADRDLSEAVAAMSAADGDRGFEWTDVTETNRSVGAATVTAEIGIDGGASPATWEFSLVAEEGDPQWLICGITAG
ncbi:hypothetical protein [Glycomyces albidus]|jgi:hypothetical protein|uniref:DUF4878 domain-containing protein n=1 Tax=Glycomyces albidus TaxID=2656774 RepID=A0A6L5GCE5_9ACTN|nr:hypothetical protein [Glycomyces albidus]MQM27310.1 hypothetical protein [Glycomyces albidus]